MRRSGRPLALRAMQGRLFALLCVPLVLGAVQQTPTANGDPVDSPAIGTPDDPIELTWRALAGLDYRTGDVSEQLQDAVGKTVRIPGFTVPLEDFASSATEFLLVPYVGACVHTPPPPPNQLVYVEMDGGKRAKMDGWEPVWLEGVLHIEDVSSIYGSSSFRVVGVSVKPYE